MVGEPDEARADDFAYGVDLFNAGFYWEAHVYWERSWRAARERDDTVAASFLQGLVQLSAALLKRRLGKKTGEAKLVAKSLGKLRATRRLGPSYMGVPLDPLIAAVTSETAPTIQLSV